eukprot:scaffold17921_cov129-Skeletonema_marinoi.AAC.1
MKFSALSKSTKRSSKKERSSSSSEEIYVNSVYAVESLRDDDDELVKYSVKLAQTSSEEEERDTRVKEIEYAVKNLCKLKDEVSQMEMRLIKLKRSVSRAEADKIGVSVSFSEVEDYDDTSQCWDSYEEEEGFFRVVGEEADALCIDPRGYFVKGVTEEVPTEIGGRGIPLCGILSADNCAVFGNGNVKKKKAATKAQDDEDVDDNDPQFLLEDEAPTSLDRDEDNGCLLLLEAANETPPVRKCASDTVPPDSDSLVDKNDEIDVDGNVDVSDWAHVRDTFASEEEASIKIKSKRSIACGGMLHLLLAIKEEKEIEEDPPSVSKRFACGAGTIFTCRGKDKDDEIEVIVPDWTKVHDSFDGKSLIMQAASTPLPPSYDESCPTEM